MLFSACAVLAASLLSARSVRADTIQYVFAGDAAANFDGYPIPTFSFTLTLIEDSSTIDNHGNGTYTYDNTTATLNSPYGSAVLTGLTLETDAAGQDIDLFNSTKTAGLGLAGSGALQRYNFAYNVSTGTATSSTSPAYLTPTYGGAFTTSTGDSLQMTSNSDLSFTATDLTPAVPEPSTLSMLSLGLVGAGVVGRKVSGSAGATAVAEPSAAGE